MELKVISRHTILNKLNYDKETGKITWKFTLGRCIKDKIAGWLIQNRRYIRIDGEDYPATNIIWMYCYGKWPKQKILFKDGNPLNLKLSNLRDSGVKEKPNQERLKQLLKYIPDTGKFIWLKGRNKGKIAGVETRWGYVIIGVDGGRYQASNLAWVYMEGYWPEHDIDHINRNRLDNRWNNLRHASRQCNIRNRGINRNNKTGITGISRHKKNGRWYVDISNKHAGSYDNFDDAVMARWKAEKAHGYPNCQTTSTAYLYLKEKGII